MGGPNRHWRDRRVAELLETNFQKVGLAQHSTFKNKFNEQEDEDDDDDSEVNSFLNEESAPVAAPKRSSPPVRPIPIRWPPPATKKEVDSASETGSSWGVQLGTYKSLKAARFKAKQTLTILKSGEISTPKVTKGKNSFYGARLLGLPKQKQKLLAKNMLRHEVNAVYWLLTEAFTKQRKTFYPFLEPQFLPDSAREEPMNSWPLA